MRARSASRFLLVVPVLVAAGCSGGAHGDDFVAPRGFSEAQVERIVLEPHAFVRGDDGSLGTARRSTHAARRGIAATFRGTYGEGVRVASTERNDAYVDVSPVASSSSTPKLRGDRSVVAYEDAYPGVTSVFVASGTRVEEVLSVDAPEHLPPIEYLLAPSPTFGRWDAGDDGSFYGYDVDGGALLALRPPIVEDATGKRVTGGWSMTTTADGAIVTASLDLAGLTYPLLVDPTFDTPEWSQETSSPTGLVASAGAWDTTSSCAVLFGGATSGFALAAQTWAHCSSGWKNVTPSTSPPARAYAAMGRGPSGSSTKLYLFGGEPETSGLLDDLWVATVSGGTSPNVSWSQVAKSGNWPSPRIMHGMSYDSSGGGRLLLWGGVDVAGNILSDTWAWNGSSWTELTGAGFSGTYGFATIPQISGDTSIYAIGGWNGAMLSTAQVWNGSSWSTTSIANATLSTDASGALVSNAGAGFAAPEARYVAWGARVPTTSTGVGLLYGSGVMLDVNYNDVYETDLWLARGGQWSRIGTDSTSFQPGTRESPFAIYEESRAQVVLFGGTTNATSAAVTSSPRVFKVGSGSTATLSVTAPSSGSSLTVSASVTPLSGKGSTAQGYFVYKQGVWRVAGGSCGTEASPIAATTSNKNDPTGTLGCTFTYNGALGAVSAIAVRVRDGEWYGTGCAASKTANVLCDPSTAYDGFASCGIPAAGTTGCP